MQTIKDGIYGDVEELDTQKMIKDQLNALENGVDLQHELIAPDEIVMAKSREGTFKTHIKNGPKVKTRRRKGVPVKI